MRERSEGSHAKAVVFDMDGVLVDSEHLWAESWERYAAARDVTWTLEHTRACQGMSPPEWSAYLTEVVGADHHPSVTEQAVVDSMVAAIKEGSAPLLDGAGNLLRLLSGYVPLGLATSAPRRVIDAVFAEHGIGDFFDGTVSSGEVGRGKPSPDVYLEAAARIEVPARRCVAVEDSSNGVLAAANAGMTVIAIPSAAYPLRPEAAAAAVEIAESLEQVRRSTWRQLGLIEKGVS